jgi:hypothetical protein
MNYFFIVLVMLLQLSSHSTFAQETVAEQIAEKIPTHGLYSMLFSLDLENLEDVKNAKKIILALKHKHENLERYLAPQLKLTCNVYLEASDLQKEAFKWLIQGYMAGLDVAYMADLKKVVHTDFSIVMNTVSDICKADRAEILALAVLETYLKLVRQS